VLSHINAEYLINSRGVRKASTILRKGASTYLWIPAKNKHFSIGAFTTSKETMNAAWDSLTTKCTMIYALKNGFSFVRLIAFNFFTL